MGAVRSGLGCLSWVGAVIIVIALVLKVALFDMAEVAGNGMAPTLLGGERVLINKRAKPELGSIVVCPHPTDVGWVIGRVAATGGMSIDSYDKELRIDGEPVVFDREGATPFHNADTDLTTSLTWGTEYFGTRGHRIFMNQDGRHLVRETDVPAGELYLLNDYRTYAVQDSRIYGLIDASTCRGTVVFRVTPAEGLERDMAHGYFELIQ